jgi:DMSO/TMAO reductase YedYZ molybdopterin-dependent catalytic subunit
VTRTVGAGALSGASLTAILAAATFVGWKVAGLPFPPFDLFDQLARMLPGAIVTLWIDAAIVVVRALGVASTSAAAKQGEQALAIALFLAAGAACGAVSFAALAYSSEPATLFGLFLGAALAAGTIVVERSLDRVSGALDPGAMWLLATLLAWGVALGWVYDRWRGLSSGDRTVTAGAGDSADAARGDVALTDGRSLDRRRFLTRLAWGATLPSVLIALCAAAITRGRASLGARWSDSHALPNADAAVTPLPGTRAELTPLERHYRVDIDTRPPQIDAGAWRLKIGGLVERPISMTLDDLRREPPVDQFITLSCISNPLGGDLIGTQRWTGASLRRVLERATPGASATHAKVKSVDGFFEIISLSLVESDPRVVLAYAWDGVPLATGHGFPLRVYVPDVYGMKQPKWIEEIELVAAWQPGYWVERGWDREGRVLTTAVVDTAVFDRTRGVVSAGGMAYAGARGISRVDVRLDDNEWVSAAIREPMSNTTWVLWRAAVPAPTPPSRVAVRAVDGEAMPQPEPFHTLRVRG